MGRITVEIADESFAVLQALSGVHGRTIDRLLAVTGLEESVLKRCLAELERPGLVQRTGEGRQAILRGTEAGKAALERASESVGRRIARETAARVKERREAAAKQRRVILSQPYTPYESEVRKLQQETRRFQEEALDAKADARLARQEIEELRAELEQTRSRAVHLDSVRATLEREIQRLKGQAEQFMRAAWCRTG